MESFHCAGADVVATTNPTEACTGVSIAIMVGGFPRKAHMERKDIMAQNGSIYSKHAYALEKYACKDCKVSQQVAILVLGLCVLKVCLIGSNKLQSGESLISPDKRVCNVQQH